MREMFGVLETCSCFRKPGVYVKWAVTGRQNYFSLHSPVFDFSNRIQITQ